MARPARKMALPRLISTLIALTLLSSGPALSAAPSSSYTPFTATGSVIANHDGDTFKLQTQGHGILTVRFSGIDTPETGQSFWKSARRALARLVKDQQVTVNCYKKSHDRDVCHVFMGRMDIGLEMVKLGMAWYAFQYAAELSPSARQAYAQAERDAKEGRLGFWAQPDPMPPWECRKLRKAGQKCR